MPAPDRFSVEALIGWRNWRVNVATATLQSLAWEECVWPYCEELCAECLASIHPILTQREPHGDPSPLAECTCGIWAYTTPDPALSRLRQELEFRLDSFPLIPTSYVIAMGQVSLWGTVIEHERGWRAARAYPYSISIPALDRVDCEALALGLRSHYAVDVELVEP